MTTSTSDLGDKFRRGATRGQASRTTIVNGNGFTYLVDYGWAVLAKRNKRTGRITAYPDWWGYSPSTSKHISQLHLHGVKWKAEGRKKLSDLMR
ncbi:MAG: hypothetical protein PVI03_01475 [Candidatus Thorarchaeota archaeon]|jgi:hypothetical protein